MDFDAFWKGLAENPPEESQPREFEELPDGAFVLVETAGEKNGKAAPGFTDQVNKDESVSLKFKVGLMAKGGDPKTSDKHLNAMIWMDLFVRPGPEEKDNLGKPLGGRFTGFLNMLFAPGVNHEDTPTRHALRWAATMKVLRQTAETYSLTLAQYGEDQAKFLAGLAVRALLDQPRQLIVKTKVVTSYKDKKSGNQVKLDRPRTEVSMMEDATAAGIGKRNIVMFKTPEQKPTF